MLMRNERSAYDPRFFCKHVAICKEVLTSCGSDADGSKRRNVCYFALAVGQVPVQGRSTSYRACMTADRRTVLTGRDKKKGAEYDRGADKNAKKGSIRNHLTITSHIGAGSVSRLAAAPTYDLPEQSWKLAKYSSVGGELNWRFCHFNMDFLKHFCQIKAGSSWQK